MTSATAVPATVPSASASNGTNDLVLLVVPGVIWGASFLFIAEGLRAVGPHGVALVALPQLGGSAATAGSASGVMLVFAALILYGISLNLARPLQMQYGALPVLVRALGVALVITAPLGLSEVLRAHWTPAPLFSLLALGSLGTGIAYVLGTIAAGRLGATRASASIFITAPVALMLGAAVLHEHVDRVSIIGAVVCILGALIIRREPAQTAVATRAG